MDVGYHECRNIYNNCRKTKDAATCISLIRNFTCSSPSPCDNEDHGLHMSIVVIYVLIAIFSLFSNTFVCLVFYLYKEIRHGKNYFIVNLAVADILIAVLAIPFFLAIHIDESQITLCKVGAVMDVLCCTSSIMDLAVISLERFIAIGYPLRYKIIVCSSRCLWVITLVWIYSIVLSLSAYIPVGDIFPKSCVFFSEPYIIVVTITSFFLPLFAMLVTYGWIFKVAKSHTRQMIRNSPAGVNNTFKREFKTAKTLTLIIGAFVICWFPFFVYISLPVVFAYKSCSKTFHHSVHIIRYLNSLINPFIYVSINKEFRFRAFKLLKKWNFVRRSRNRTELSRTQRFAASLTADTIVNTAASLTADTIVNTASSNVSLAVIHNNNNIHGNNNAL